MSTGGCSLAGGNGTERGGELLSTGSGGGEASSTTTAGGGGGVDDTGLSDKEKRGTWLGTGVIIDGVRGRAGTSGCGVPGWEEDSRGWLCAGGV